jgi:hypothetical protein
VHIFFVSKPLNYDLDFDDLLFIIDNNHWLMLKFNFLKAVFCHNPYIFYC